MRLLRTVVAAGLLLAGACRGASATIRLTASAEPTIVPPVRSRRRLPLRMARSAPCVVAGNSGSITLIS